MNSQDDRTPDAPRDGDPSAVKVLMVGLVGATWSFALILALQALFYSSKDQAVLKANPGTPRELVQMRSEQAEAIGGYRWADREQGVLAIPIDRAMELTAAELATASGDRGEGAGR